MKKIITNHLLFSAVLVSAPAWAVNKDVMSPEEIANAFEAQAEAQKNATKRSLSNGDVNRAGSNEKTDQTTAIVRIGMSESEVRGNWGPPNKVNATTTAGGTNEQWIYYRGKYRTQYVYLTNGVVRSIQKTEH